LLATKRVDVLEAPSKRSKPNSRLPHHDDHNNQESVEIARNQSLSIFVDFLEKKTKVEQLEQQLNLPLLFSGWSWKTIGTA
jgi:hypothetical protein